MQSQYSEIQLISGNFLEDLPPELLPRILINLDSFSLRALLRAYPGIARSCILIFDEWVPSWDNNRLLDLSQFGSFFYECHDLRKLPLSQYNPQAHKSHFKIYEATAVPHNLYRQEIILQDRFPYISRKDSFVHYYSSAMSGKHVHPPDGGCGFLEEHTVFTSLRQGGYAYQATACLRKENVFYRLPSNSMLADLSNVKSIRLEGIEKLESLTLPPTLRTLALVFNKSHKNPVIRNLSLPRFVCLEIYYYDRVPLITELQIPSFDSGSYMPHRPAFNRIILAHIPSLAGNLVYALPPHPEETRDFSYISNALNGNFGDIRIIGGPNAIVRCLVLSRGKIHSLHIKQACQYLSPEHRLTKITGNLDALTTFKFDTVLENPIVPVLAVSNDVNLLVISLTSQHGLDLSQFFLQQRFTRHIWLLYIHVTCQNSAEFVSPIGVLMKCFEGTNFTLRALEIVGLRRSPNVNEEELKARVTGGNYGIPDQEARISLID